MATAVLQPPFDPQQNGYPSLSNRFQPPPYSQPHYPVHNMGPYPHHQQSYIPPPPQMMTHDHRAPMPPLPLNVPGGPMPGQSNKRMASQGAHPAESPAKKKQSKWSGEEDAAIIELRGNGMKWEDISKHLPGRSAISCRLRFQNYLERRSEWDDEKKNKLARLYERFKKDMWEKIAKEMQLPWRAAEAMHWQIGEVEMASRANVPVFHLANPTTQSSSQAAPAPQGYPYQTSANIPGTENNSANTSPSTGGGAYHVQGGYPPTHSHTLPLLAHPVSPLPGHAIQNSVSSVAGTEQRIRADSAREMSNTPTTTNGYGHHHHNNMNRPEPIKRYHSTVMDRPPEVAST